METAVAEAREHRRMRTLPIDKTTLQMLRDYIQRGGPVERGGRKLIFGVNRHRSMANHNQVRREGRIAKANES